MALVGFCKKINSQVAKKIEKRNELFFIENHEVYYMEMCGIIIDQSHGFITIADYYGKTELLIKKISFDNIVGSFTFLIVPAVRQNKVVLVCKEVKRASAYEEIAFNFEVQALLQQNKHI